VISWIVALRRNAQQLVLLLTVFVELSCQLVRIKSEGKPRIILGMKSDNSSDSELLQAMRAGDEEALAALYRRRQPGIYRFALQMCGSQELAEDITQEVFMVLMREAHTFDPARGSLSAFLMGIARHHVLRRLQRERFYVSLNEAPDNGGLTSQVLVTTVGPLDLMSRAEAIEAVRRAVLALPERYREVVVLCDLQEVSYGEAAEILGCAIGTVRSRLHRARALLIEKLRPAREEDLASATVKSTRCFA
jgi:RNA polymerase sigma-70 factor, ECF subfamily